MYASEVAVDNVTSCAVVYVPPAGLKTGAETVPEGVVGMLSVGAFVVLPLLAV
jgi:hypothetical protein